MANPIKVTDLYQHGDDFKKLSADLDEAKEKYIELIKLTEEEAIKLQVSLKKSRGAGKKQREEIEAGAKQADEIAKRYKKYNESLGENAVKIAALKNAQQKINLLNKLEAKVLASKEGSYNRLAAQYAINKLQLNQLSEAERKSTKSGQELETTTNDIFQKMKALQEATGKHALSVGDYTKSIREASKEQSRISKELKATKKLFEEVSAKTDLSESVAKEYEERIKSLTAELDNLGTVTGKTSKDFEEGLIDQLSNVEGAAGDAVRGVKSVGSSFKALLKNPVVLFIALIVGAIATLVGAFSRSEKGAELMAKATGLMNGVLSQLTNIAVGVAESIESAFNDPIQAVKNLGNAIVKNLWNRLNALPLLAKSALDALKALWNSDMEALAEAGEDAFFAINQSITGLDEQQTKDFSKAVSEATKEVIKETNAFIKLESAKRAVRKANRSLVKSIEELTTAEAVSNAIAGDTTKSFKEREEANRKAAKAGESRSKKEIQLARNNLSLINQEISLRKGNGEVVEDLLDRQLDAYRELASAQRELTLATIDNDRTQAELQQDRLERDLDILIDGFDNQKTVNERRLKNDQLTEAERVKILQDTRKLSDASFEKQIQTIQKFTGIAVDANELIGESDAVVLNEKIRALGLSEIIEGRLLEIVRDRKSANQELADSEIELSNKIRSERLKSLQDVQKVAKIEFDTIQRTEAEKAQFVIDQKQEQLKAIQDLNNEFDGVLPPIDTSALEAQIKQFIALLSNAKKATEQTLFDQQSAFAQSEFDLLKTTEREKTQFRLNAEKDRLKKILELNAKFGSNLTALQVQTIKNQIAKIDNEITKSQGGFKDIYEVFGFKLDDGAKSAIKESTSLVLDQVTQIGQARLTAANDAVSASNDRVAQAQRELEIQLQNKDLGLANTVQAAQQELQVQKDTQREALKEKRKAARAQLVLDTAQQASSLITASAKIWSQLGFPFAIPAIGAMFGAFVTSKVKAFQLAKKQFGKGGFVEIGGGSHASGNDTPLGFQTEGKQAYGERGEVHTIYDKKTVKKYGASKLRDVYESFKKGVFESKYENVNVAGHRSDSGPVNYQINEVDNSRIERSLEGIRKQGEGKESVFTDSKGRTVIVSKNKTTIHA